MMQMCSSVVSLHVCVVSLHVCVVSLHVCVVSLHVCVVALHVCVVSLHVCVCFCITSDVQTARLHEICLPNAVHARRIQVQLSHISQYHAADTTSAHVSLCGYQQQQHNLCCWIFWNTD